MIDANQSVAECYSSNGLKPFSIEWLRIQRGMIDPFIAITQQRPNSITLTPNRDIDYILMFGIEIQNITTLGPDHPAISDHLGITFDIDPEKFFSSQFPHTTKENLRNLAANNGRSVNNYIK
jgi:hypothetical protein